MKRRNKSAETLLETIIAVSMFMIIIGPASMLYASSVRNTAYNRDDLIGVGLAEEGLEMMRNMRDTNFLRFADRKEACWNTKPDFAAGNCADASSKIGNPDTDASQGFLLKLSLSDFGWNLVSASGSGLDLRGNPTDAEQYRLRLDSGETGTGVYFNPIAADASRGTPSPFYREVSIRYINLPGPTVLPPRAMKAVSTVQYLKGNIARTIKRTLILTNDTE